MSVHSEIILQAQDVHAWYDSSHVLHGVSLDIRKGETVGLLGRNGMGKSTLIRTLLGHVPQRDGHISLFGHDISRARPHEVARQGVAYVPEGRGVFGNLTVRENLVVAARPGRDVVLWARDAAQVAEIAKLLGQPLMPWQQQVADALAEDRGLTCGALGLHGVEVAGRRRHENALPRSRLDTQARVEHANARVALNRKRPVHGRAGVVVAIDKEILVGRGVP